MLAAALSNLEFIYALFFVFILLLLRFYMLPEGETACLFICKILEFKTIAHSGLSSALSNKFTLLWLSQLNCSFHWIPPSQPRMMIFSGFHCESFRIGVEIEKFFVRLFFFRMRQEIDDVEFSKADAPQTIRKNKKLLSDRKKEESSGRFGVGGGWDELKINGMKIIVKMVR